MNEKNPNNQESDVVTNWEVQDKTDAELIEWIGARDERALADLYQRYYSRLFSFVVHVAGRLNQIDDMINAVMFLVWEQANTFNKRCKPSVWILGIAYHITLKSLDRHRLDTNDISMQGQVVDSGYKVNNSENRNIKVKDWLEAAFESLSAEERAVMDLTFCQGLNYDEIAELTECNADTVRIRMSCGRKKASSVFCEEHSPIQSTFEPTGNLSIRR